MFYVLIIHKLLLTVSFVVLCSHQSSPKRVSLSSGNTQYSIFLSWVSYTSVQQLCNNCVAHLPQRTLNIRCTRQKVARHRGIFSSPISLARFHQYSYTHHFLLFLCFMITERRTGVAHCARAFTTNNNNVLHLGFYFVLTLIYGVDGGGSAPDAGTHLPP